MSEPALPAAPTSPWTLRAAASVVSIEALVESIVVIGRTSLTPGLRMGLIASIALKWAFAWWVVRLNPGAALGLFLLEGTTIVAALGAVDTSTPARVALGASALTVVVLLSASLHAFPSPTLPKG